MRPLILASLFCLAVAARAGTAEEPLATLPLRVSWGHEQAQSKPFFLKIIPEDVQIAEITPRDFEDGDALRDGECLTRAGGGDCDGVDLALRYRPVKIEPLAKLTGEWEYLLAHGDRDTADRLRDNPGFRPDTRRLTFRMDPEGTRGFSLSLDQLLQARSLWIPSLGVYLDAADPPRPFAEHRAALERHAGRRVLDKVAREPEATYEQFKRLWEDMGSPEYRHAYECRHDRLRAEPPPGHVVCLTWDSAIAKYGIDRTAGAWSDFGNPDVFRVWFDFGEPPRLRDSWKGQRLTDGLPVIVTTFEEGSARCQIEQFAYPLPGPPAQRRGDVAMVLLQKVRLIDLSGKENAFPLRLHHLRKAPAAGKRSLARADRGVLLEDAVSRETFLGVEGLDVSPEIVEEQSLSNGMTRTTLGCRVAIPAGGAKEFVVKLPSPPVAQKDRPNLLDLGYAAARAATLRFWADYEARGARFQVPEPAVNDLFRANLWHALRLPRRHGGPEAGVKIDLPYSNFGYGQTGTDWPVNQAVLVDYMIYDLRGYHEIAAEEILAIFRDKQEPNGHVGAAANWLVYTPGMLYAVAQNYLLSRNAAAFDRLLPQSLMAMDWCLAEIERAKEQPGIECGLVRGPLNDCTGPGLWAFNQAYLQAGLELFGRALRERQHPRADECQAVARELRNAIGRAFQTASARSALVQLADRTWIPHVPCEPDRRERLFAEWYPTEVDTGAVHLLRLRVLPARGELADFLLNDHEDNLFLNGWGMANEPVYNQQAMAYLLRDEPKAAIRAFYSMMACAFSHTVYEPVEHRWGHYQVFGPPSTDGTWFELYRHMLLHERDDGALVLLQAAPRAWLGDGKRIVVERAPTYFGPVSLSVQSHAAEGFLLAEARLGPGPRPATLAVRFRHPEGKAIRSVTVNDQPWNDFDAKTEYVKIPNPTASDYRIRAEYQ